MYTMIEMKNYAKVSISLNCKDLPHYDSVPPSSCNILCCTVSTFVLWYHSLEQLIYISFYSILRISSINTSFRDIVVLVQVYCLFIKTKYSDLEIRNEFYKRKQKMRKFITSMPITIHMWVKRVKQVSTSVCFVSV